MPLGAGESAAERKSLPGPLVSHVNGRAWLREGRRGELAARVGGWSSTQGLSDEKSHGTGV